MQAARQQTAQSEQTLAEIKAAHAALLEEL